MLSLIFFALAAIMSACMDTLTHHHDKSLFADFKGRFWADASESWKNKYVDGDSTKGRVKWKILGFKFTKPVQFTDAWHFFKLLMILFLCAAIITFKPVYNIYLDFAVLGFVWNVVFSFFYNKVLIVN